MQVMWVGADEEKNLITVVPVRSILWHLETACIALQRCTSAEATSRAIYEQEPQVNRGLWINSFVEKDRFPYLFLIVGVHDSLGLQPVNVLRVFSLSHLPMLLLSNLSGNVSTFSRAGFRFHRCFGTSSRLKYIPSGYGLQRTIGRVPKFVLPFSSSSSPPPAQPTTVRVIASTAANEMKSILFFTVLPSFYFLKISKPHFRIPNLPSYLASPDYFVGTLLVCAASIMTT
jgi:hypothetical protein